MVNELTVAVVLRLMFVVDQIGAHLVVVFVSARGIRICGLGIGFVPKYKWILIQIPFSGLREPSVIGFAKKLLLLKVWPFVDFPANLLVRFSEETQIEGSSSRRLLLKGGRRQLLARKIRRRSSCR